MLLRGKPSSFLEFTGSSESGFLVYGDWVVPELGLWAPCAPWSGESPFLLASESCAFAACSLSSSSRFPFFSLCSFQKMQMTVATLSATAAMVRGRAILHSAVDQNLLEKEANRDSRVRAKLQGESASVFLTCGHYRVRGLGASLNRLL